MGSSSTKLKIETLFSDLREYDKKWSDTFKEISKYQNECEHYYDDGLSAIKYNGTDTVKDFYKCEICQKDFMFNPHKK